MTATEIRAYLGTFGKLAHDGLTVQVEVLNAREAWGRLDLEVTPVAGSGRRWVSAARVTLDKERG